MGDGIFLIWPTRKLFFVVEQKSKIATTWGQSVTYDSMRNLIKGSETASLIESKLYSASLTVLGGSHNSKMAITAG